MKNRGGSSQDRRRARRAAARETVAPLVVTIPADELDEIRHIAASAATLEPRELAPGEILEEGELGPNATATLVAPEDAALALLDEELAPVAGRLRIADDAGETIATFRIIFPDDALAEAGTLLVSRAELVAEGEDADFDRETLGEALERSFLEGLSRETSRPAGTFTLTDFEITLPAELQPGERVPAPGPTVADPEVPTLARGPAEWTAIFVPEATLTDDGRAFAPDALTWRELPLTLMGLNETSAEGGHDGAVACGRIDRVWRDGHLIRAAGVFSEDETGIYFATNVGDGTIRGLSVDIAIHEYEVGPRSDYFDEAGNWQRRLENEAEEPSLEDILFGGDVEDRIFVVTKAVIGMATVCPFPAFAGANISLLASGAIWSYTHQGGFTVVQGKPIEALVSSAATVEAITVTPLGEDGEPLAALTAAAAGLAPLKPPVEWFQDPELEELTGLTIDDDGRIFGHAWPWGACHTGLPGCTTAPHSLTNYAYFRTGELECEDGSRISVGRITFDTGHAGQRLSKAGAIAHYDDTGKVGAYVVVGEDEFGGWVAGTLAALVSEEDAQKIRGATPSGDWRVVDGNLELIGLLAVNVPGFPVPRPRALVASAGEGELEIVTLTAAGVAEMLRERTPEDDFREIEALAAEARGDFAELAAAARG